MPTYIAQEFIRQLNAYGIDAYQINFTIVSDPRYTVVAGTTETGFLINIAYADYWKCRPTRISTIAHEITHFLEGHSHLDRLITEHTQQEIPHYISNCHYKIQETIADLLLAIYNRDIAYALHEKTSKPELKRTKIYPSAKELNTYTTTIIDMHEKELYKELSFTQNLYAKFIVLITGRHVARYLKPARLPPTPCA